MTRNGTHRRRRSRGFRRKAALICAAGLALAAACVVGSVRLVGFLRAKSKERFIRGGSGATYTPAGAAKRAVEKVREEP